MHDKMFHPYKVDENPSVIPIVTNNMNHICNSYITNMIRQIAKDYDHDYKELLECYNNPMKFHLAGNVHYPPPQDIRCIARVRGKGYGRSQCKRKATEKKLCLRHFKQFKICSENECTRGINGLGACTDHKGLRLGFTNKPIPIYNDEGKVVVKWKREYTFKRRTEPVLKKSFKYKIKSKTETKIDTHKKLSTTYLKNDYILPD